MGFKDLQQFNDALLVKISWRIITQPTCLLARVVLNKYCHDTSFMDCEPPNSAFTRMEMNLYREGPPETPLRESHRRWQIDKHMWQNRGYLLISNVDRWDPLLKTPKMCYKQASYHLQQKNGIARLLDPSYHKDEILEIRTSKSGAKDKVIWATHRIRNIHSKVGLLGRDKSRWGSKSSGRRHRDWRRTRAQE